MIFILLIFVIPGAFQDTLSGGAETGEAFLSWESLDGTPQVLEEGAFYSKKQEYSRLSGIYPFIGMQEMNASEDADVSRMIVIADIARGAGVRVTDGDLAENILTLFQTAGGYTDWVNNQPRYSKKEFESTLRDVIVVQRFMRLLAVGAGSVDHEELVRDWQGRHIEYSFYYVEARTAEFESEVEGTLPDAAALEAWLMARPAGEQSKFHTPEAWSADFAVMPLPLGEGAGDLLLAAYPRPEDEEASQKARDYHQAFIESRFIRPEDEADAQGPAPSGSSFSFEEVEEVCAAEAPIYYSLTDWHLDVQQRVAAGEEVDLAKECERLGLTLVSDGVARTLEDWSGLEAEWADGTIGNVLRFTAAGRFTPSLRVQPSGVSVARVVEKFASALPEFSEIESEVAAAWVKDTAATRAKYTLDGIADRIGERKVGEPFEPKTTPEQFATAANNAGDHAQKDFTVKRRDFQERSSQLTFGEELTPIEEHLRANTALFTLEEGRVVLAQPSQDKESVFLVLVGPTRPADVSKMQPQELTVARSQMLGESVREFFATTFDFESDASKKFMRENFSYYLKSDEPKEEDA